jgi:hypothetical protein
MPDEEHVAGQAPPAFIAMVETKAEEIVRAAAALHLDGTAFEGVSEGTRDAFVPGGMFRYLVIPRHECVYVVQVTAWPA